MMRGEVMESQNTILKRGDIVYYIRAPDTELVVCGEPWEYNGSLAVECRKAKRKENGFTHNLYDVKALVKKEDAIKWNNRHQ